ncbi:flavin reductase (DIM6/NTAB) family NADH-FMN oxidoreductase RutF [Litorimonas taeanensis]|uniref:Flavin reductase (DIM6/NTAB) family NADH-FMN oxidoreductase RutF n=1 Tax=Litorimonas taeanensis TaxID=568099 RepID=A0A420WJX0_9PROT|nr:LysR substrate-binding domain-containing protein [Litorimonas taeanensis]RKQ71195.1 flavin reductase (DIM6/NTAB) family NADH-FMN oxidoreductase RutF [Litorimonas taeanensis]
MTVIDQELKNKFFEGMSFAAATVNVITSDGPAGRVGLTVSAMSSVSADTPRPTLLVCINENSAAAASLLENGVFCVNVLHNHQSYISDVFAGRYKDTVEDKFECSKWAIGKTGSPRVEDGLVGFDCEITSTVKVGTHHVIFGEVVEISVAEKGSALIYANRAYGSSQPIVVPNTDKSNDISITKPLAVGCFHTFAPFFVPELVEDLTRDGDGLSVELIEGDNKRVKDALLSGEIEIGLLYDFDLPESLETTLLSTLTPYVLLAEDHPLANNTVIRNEDLHEQPMISIAEDTSRDQLEGVLRSRGIEPKVIFRAASFEMMRGMVGHGLGFAIAMTQTGPSRSYDGKPLISRPLADPLPSHSIVLAKRRDATLSDAASQVMQKAYSSAAWA